MPLFRSKAEDKVRDAGYDPARLPPGQYLTEKWPVLQAGSVPHYPDLSTWTLRVFGEVENELELTWEQLEELPALNKACRKAGIPLEFSFLPWQRAQLEALGRNDVLIIPFTRTPSREAQYQWVAPVLEFHTVLVTLTPPPSSIEDARTRVVGYVRGTSFKDEVEHAGFPYVEESDDDVTNAKKLKRGRIGAWITTDLMARGVYRQAGFDPAELMYGPTLGPVKVSWVAASREFPKDVARRIAAAIEQMRADGSYQAIVKRYQ